MFHRPGKPAGAVSAKSVKNITRTQTATQFLAEEKRHNLLTKIRDLSALEPSRFDSLCSILIDNLVSYCQSLPETANSYYSQPGGVVDFALSRTEAALTLFQEVMILDKEQALSEEQKLWQYALFSAAILQGIGKLCIDYKINLFDAQGQILKQWNPLLESLTTTGTQYNYEFMTESDVEFRRRLNLLLARTLIPVSGFNWIASNQQVLAIWLALLNEDMRSAGTLGALLTRAKGLAIHRYLQEFMLKAATKTSPYGRAGTFSGGVPESLTDKELAIGVEFLEWLNKQLAAGDLIINKAPLFIVPGGLILPPEIFKLFVQSHPQYKTWLAIQKGLLSLCVHSSGHGDDPVSRFEQINSHQMHSGVVIPVAVVVPDSVQVQQLATGKVETMSAMELINKAQYPSHFTQQQTVLVVPPLQQLSAAGKWQNIVHEVAAARPGAKSGA
ncbi:MAG: TraI domain-containing protein [Legionella sp.]